MSEPLIKHLTHRLTEPLPGLEAQLKMAHITRRMHNEAPADARQAGVLVLLFPKNETWHVVLIERPANDRDRHGGQISFPGGKYEPQDGTLLRTALREAEEEIGVVQEAVNILGPLTGLYIPVSNFQVNPFVGWLDRQPAYRPQQSEVKAILEIPLSHFRPGDAPMRTTSIRVSPHLTLNHVPYFDVDGRTLWGATAMIMSELMEILDEH